MAAKLEAPQGLPSWVKIVRSDLSEYEAKVVKGPTAQHAQMAFEFLRERMSHEEVEVQYTLALDAFGRILGAWEAARGTRTQVDSAGCEVFRPAVALGAAAVVAAHNHPSSENPIRPSTEDLLTHMALTQAGNTLSIPLVDSLIMSGDRFLSVHEYLNEKKEMRAMLSMRLFMQTLVGQKQGGGDPESGDV